MTYDAVVIGGGISGMTAALLLAKHGLQVALLERSSALAPILSGFSRAGLYFDTGFHYAGGLGKGEALARFFCHLGIGDKIVTEPYAKEGFDLFRSAPGSSDFAFACGFERAEQLFLERFPGEGEAIRNYLTTIRGECRKLPYLNLEVDFDPQLLMGALQGPSLQEYLDSQTSNRELQQVLSLHALLYGVPPEEMPLALHASVVAPYIDSACGIEGGGRQLVRAFRERLAELGVEVFTGRHVEEIELDERGRVAAVRTSDGARFACRRAISSVAPRALLTMVPEGALRPAYRKRLERLEETPSAHLLFAACSDSTLLARRNLFLDGHANPFAGLETTPIARRTLYLARARAEADAPQRQGLVVICPAQQQETAAWAGSRRGQRPEAYRAFKQQMMETLGARVERCCPELGSVTPLAGSTPLTLADYSGNPGGGIYGVKHKIGQYNPQPPTRIEGLLLTGQATAAPGLLGATLSAYLCCGHLLGHDILRNEVKACS